MDLLGRKAKSRYEAEFAWSNRLTEHLNDYMVLVSSQREALTELSARVESRESLIRDLLFDVGRLEGELKARRASSSGDRIKPPKPAMHVGEEEAELEWQRDNGLLSPADYAHLLSELDFQNTEIQIDPDYRPRPDLTY